jgi:hypothetical protein
VKVRGVHDVSDRQQLITIATSTAPSAASSATLQQNDTCPETVPCVVHFDNDFRESTGIAVEIEEKIRTLPGVETLWDLKNPEVQDRAEEEIRRVSWRLVELAALLGVDRRSGSDVDIAYMLLREPRLLEANIDEITRRLFELRIKLDGRLNIQELVGQQPSLLLQDFSEIRCIIILSTRNDLHTRLCLR